MPANLPCRRIASDAWSPLVAGAVALVAGVLWQLLARRDLVDRLWFPALALLVIPFLWLGSADAEWDESAAVAAAGLLGALILTESWLRGRREAEPAATSAA